MVQAGANGWPFENFIFMKMHRYMADGRYMELLSSDALVCKTWQAVLN
jgi:hypothetical protein